jgi:glucokinase
VRTVEDSLPGTGRRGAVVGVDLGGTKCHAVLADESGAVLCEDYRRTSELPDPAQVLLRSVAHLRGAAAAAGREVGAVAIGIPAFVDPVSGLVVGGGNLGWDGFDLSAVLDPAVPEPHLVENDVNLAAIGEARVGAGRGATSFVTVSVGTGLGGAVVVGGEVLRGHHSAAGEIGFLVAGRSQLRRPGLLAMESLVGGWSIAARARELALADPGATELTAASDAAAVFAAAARGDRVAEQLLEEVLDHVAMTVIDLAAVLDPERVVLDGSIGRALGPHLPRLAAVVADAVLYAPELHVSALRPSAALAGAVAEAQRLAAAGHPPCSPPRPDPLPQEAAPCPEH